jgi:hypothetical protein
MTPIELTEQAFKLYDNIRIQSYSTPARSDLRKRLHSLGLKAFYRYKRRLEAEQNHNSMVDASHWGF